MSEENVLPWARRLAPVLMLLAICIGCLTRKDYPLLTPEVFLILIGVVILGAALGMLCDIIPEWASALLLGALAIVFGDLVISAWPHVENFLGSHFDEVLGPQALHGIRRFVIFVVPLAGAIAVRRTLPWIVLVTMTVFIVEVLVEPPEVGGRTVITNPPVAGAPPGKLVLHIVLDEFVGNEGIGTDFPNSTQLRADISQFFLSRGFSLHEGAFSSYKSTIFSLSGIMTFTRPLPSDGEEMARMTGPKPFAWFRKLRDDGLRIEYVGTSYFPACTGVNAPLISACTLFPMYSLRYIRNDRRSASERALDLVGAAIRNSLVVHHVCQDIHMCRDSDLPYSWMAADQFDTMQRILAEEGGNLALVAHVLIPHKPPIYSASCVRRPIYPRLEFNTREALERAYSEQVRCALNRLKGIVDIVDRRWPGAVVIVHGDHGFKMPSIMARENDIRMNYAALFAVRRPGIKPEVVSKQENLQALFAFYAGGVRLPESRVVYSGADGAKSSRYPR